MRSVIAVLLLTAAVYAQNARVVPVDSQTAAKLTILTVNVKEAQKALDDAVLEVQHRLLTVVKGDSNRSSCFAYREGESALTATTLITGTTYSGWTTSINSACETPEEKSRRAVADKKADDDRAKWEADHPSKYWLEGWCDGSEFTDDFRYLVPKPKSVFKPTPGVYWNGNMPLGGMSN